MSQERLARIVDVAIGFFVGFSFAAFLVWINAR